MNKKVLLLHGWGGSDYPHWQSWLAGELAKDYGFVSFLRFSNPDAPKLNRWKEELKNHLQEFQPDVIICHSLANILWFHMCNDDSIDDVKELYLVAPPRIDCTIEKLKSFFPVKIPCDPHADKVLLVTSTNDHYLSEEEAQKMQKELGVEMVVMQNAGHINADSGFGEWEWILQELKK